MKKFILTIAFAIGCMVSRCEPTKGYACPYHFDIEETPCSEYYNCSQEDRDRAYATLIEERNPDIAVGLIWLVVIAIAFGVIYYKIASIGVQGVESLVGRKLTTGERIVAGVVSATAVGCATKFIANSLSKKR